MADKPIPIKNSVVAAYFTPQPRDKREITVAFKITPLELRQIDVLLQEVKGKLPWKTKSDYLYWCFVHGTRKVVEDVKSERFTNLFMQMEAERELIKSSEVRRRIRKMLTDLHREVMAYDEEGAEREVPRLLRNFEGILKAMEPNYWVKKITGEFYRDFGKRLKADRISNHPRDAERDESEK